MSFSAPLSIDDIRSTLATKSLGHHLYLHRELSSTNAEALSLAQAGEAHGTVVVAESQTAGRGRHARNWYSPPGTNVYCSIIIREIGQGVSLSEWLSWVPLTSALAAAEAVQCVAALALSVKWPNDLLYHDRKVGGILCESSLTSAANPIVVIGIGLNVNMPRESFPKELQPIAASLIEVSRHPIDRNRLISQLLLELEQSLDELHSHGPVRLRQAYTTRCTTLGRHVRVLLGHEQELLGTAEAISAGGALQIRPLSSSAAVQSPPLIDIHAADVIHLRE
ncbi:MAG: biotin--[acetyl-CoA-carboxylase] ligase [Nitrospirae bacterium]|nr:biotin--[acetyl-CoA-carboxylase] ligase [Nitrospirota bacterium]